METLLMGAAIVSLCGMAAVTLVCVLWALYRWTLMTITLMLAHGVIGLSLYRLLRRLLAKWLGADLSREPASRLGIDAEMER